MHNAYAFAEGPTPYCPFLTGTHKRYVARTHSLCSETSVLRKKCVFTTAPEVLHHAAAPPPGGLFSSHFRNTFSRAKKKRESSCVSWPKRLLRTILHIFGTQLAPQKPAKIDVFGTPRGNLCWKTQKPQNLIPS